MKMDDDAARDRFEDRLYVEALDAVEGISPKFFEQVARCLAICYLDEEKDALDVFKFLSLDIKHAYILLGMRQEFWKTIHDEAWMYVDTD